MITNVSFEDYTEPNAIPIKLKINISENFGGDLENSQHPHLIIDFLENEFEQALNEESRINRNSKRYDNRVHVALYFIKPTSKGLNEFDKLSMSLISKRVNLIPIIAKSDTLTEDELISNKKLIMNDIEDEHIDIFNFLDYELNETVSESEFEGGTESCNSIDNELNQIQSKLPFSIISGDENGFRYYPWGKVDMNDEKNCDFKLLKNILFGSHIHDFKESTIVKKYEAYRIEKLTTDNGEL